MRMHNWKGTSEELIKFYDENQFKKIIDYFKDDEDFLTMTSESNKPDTLEQLSAELKWGYVHLETFEDHIKANPKDNYDVVFALGRLRGAMDIAGRVCYMKQKSRLVALRAKEAKEYFEANICAFRFDEFIRYLDQNDDASVDDVCENMILSKSQFESQLPKLLATNMVFYRRYAMLKATIELTDDGLIYAKYLKIAEHPEDYGWD